MSEEKQVDIYNLEYPAVEYMQTDLDGTNFDYYVLKKDYDSLRKRYETTRDNFIEAKGH